MRKKIKLSIVIGVIAFLYYFAINSDFRRLLGELAVQNPYSVFIAYIATNIMFACFLLPCSQFTLLAGVIWGFELGFVFSIISTLTSASATFFIARITSKHNALRYLPARGIALITKLENGNWKSSLFVHINPIFPAASMGYIFGVTKIHYLPFLTGAFLGTIPLQIVVLCLPEVLLIMGGF